MEKVFLEAMKLWQVPEDFYEAALPMYRDYEAAVTVKMNGTAATAGQVCQWIEEAGYRNPEELLRESYGRYVFSKSAEDEDSYTASTFYERYPYFAQYEPEAYSSYSEEMVRKLNDWDLKVYMEGAAEKALAVARGEEVPMHQTQYLTLDETFEMLEGLGEEFLVLPCNCKAMERCKTKPVNVCIGKLQRGPNTPFDRGHGEILNLEQAKRLILEVNKKGLMQSGEHEWLCSCDGVCCYPLKMAKILGTRLKYPASHYEILWDKEKCIQCGKCTKICNFGAFFKGEDKQILYDAEKCWGCTICAPNCPKGAIILKKRQQPE